MSNEPLNATESGGGGFTVFGAIKDVFYPKKKKNPEIQLLLVLTWHNLNYCSIPVK